MSHTTRAPWWAWGFVAALPFALLALATPWFDAVPPSMPGVWGTDQHVHYTAWTHAAIGMICPFVLAFVAVQWCGAGNGWCPPPAPSDWRGAGRAFNVFMSGRRVWSGSTGSDNRPATVWYPYRTGAWYSIGVAVASLVVLGINRKMFHPTYYVLGTTSPVFQSGDLNVHPAFGCWCFLAATAVFLITGVFGVLQPVQPWWSTGQE